MAKRIDILGPSRRAELFSGRMLDELEDPTLQTLVQEAAKSCNAPIALVSLVTDHLQFFRAHYGLPPDLEVTRATDRDASFCQIVVNEEGVFETSHAEDDPRVPKDLVERYGIQSYLGVPLFVGGKAVGSLCVIDVEPRDFDTPQKAKMEELAALASRALEVLARDAPTAVELAVRPAFSELRNALTPLSMATRGGRMAAAELRPLVRLRTLISDGVADNALAVLSGAASALDELDSIFADIETCVGRANASILSLEAAITRSVSPVSLGEVVEHSVELGRHVLKLIGGMDIQPGEALDASIIQRGAAVVQLAAILVTVADSLYEKQWAQGLRISAEGTSSEPALRLTLPMSEIPGVGRVADTRGPATISIETDSVLLRY